MCRIGLRLLIALLTFAAGIGCAWLAGLYSKPADNLIEPAFTGTVLVQKKPRFRFVERSCESGCIETYETFDGQQLSLIDACYSGSPADARRDMESLIEDGRVVQRGEQPFRLGRLYERTVVICPKDETGESPGKIFWYHPGDVCFTYIEAGSLELVLEFERSDAAEDSL